LFALEKNPGADVDGKIIEQAATGALATTKGKP
jgi:hypothetical protein